MNQYFFIGYELSINGVRQPAGNIIVKNMPPLEWAAKNIGSRPETRIVTYVLWWQEVQELLIQFVPEVRKHFSIEGE